MKAKEKIRQILLGMSFLIPLVLAGQQSVEWSFNYGGNNSDYLTRIIGSREGGYLAGGHSMSANIDLPVNSGVFDTWFIKINEAGLKEFVVVQGGSEAEYVMDILQREDSLYLMLINSNSADGDFVLNSGLSDIWIKSMNTAGIIGGNLHFGGSGYDDASRMVQTINGGYLVVGKTNSSDGTFGGGLGGDDAFCIRLSPDFQEVWVKKYGSKENDGFVDAFALPNGELMFLGSKFQSSANTGWLVKTNSFGEVIDQVDIERSSGIFPVCMQYHNNRYYVAATTNNGFSRASDQHIIIYVFDENLDFVQSMETGGGAPGSDFIVDMKSYDSNHLLCLVVSNTNSEHFAGNHGAYDHFLFLMADDFSDFYCLPFGGSANEGMNGKHGSFCLNGNMAVAAGNSYSSDGNLPAHHGFGDGWIYKANPTYSLGVSQPEKETLPEILIRPNPAIHLIEVSNIPESATGISIYNLTGQLMATQDVKPGINRLSVDGLTRGIYILHAHENGIISASSRFIKQ